VQSCDVIFIEIVISEMVIILIGIPNQILLYVALGF